MTRRSEGTFHSDGTMAEYCVDETENGRRGAVVKAMAVCTRYPFIQIFKVCILPFWLILLRGVQLFVWLSTSQPVLLLALDAYFSNPSQDCLARLFDSINSMDISAAPELDRAEKLVMRNSERNDVFSEKFVPPKPSPDPSHISQSKGLSKGLHAPKASVDSRSSFEEGIFMRTGGPPKEQQPQGRERSGTQTSTKSTHYSTVPSDDSFSLGGKAVWVGDESGLMDQESVSNGSVGTAASRGRRSTDASSNSSHHTRKDDHINYHGSASSMATPMANGGSSDTHLRTAYAKDTHFFHTVIDYEGHQLPIKMPLSTFPEEVGDVRSSQLSILSMRPYRGAFSRAVLPHPTDSNLFEPHFNAVWTPPSTPSHEWADNPSYHDSVQRARYREANHLLGVPAARRASLQLRSIGLCVRLRLWHYIPRVHRACLPLRQLDQQRGVGVNVSGGVSPGSCIFELIHHITIVAVIRPAYIAGVTNPIFETSGSWDLLCDVGSGRVVVSKDILTAHPPSGPPAGAPPLISRTGTLKTESSVGSEEDVGRKEPLPGQAQSTFTGKSDGGDNAFIEDVRTFYGLTSLLLGIHADALFVDVSQIISAINFHFGESLVRARFTEYLQRFIRLASRYEEDVLGMTTIGYPSASFNEGPGDSSQLGSGIVFLDENAGARELAANASRIEGWRRTKTYLYFQEVCLLFFLPVRICLETCPERGDVAVWRRTSGMHWQRMQSRASIYCISCTDCGMSNICRMRRWRRSRGQWRKTSRRMIKL